MQTYAPRPSSPVRNVVYAALLVCVACVALAGGLYTYISQRSDLIARGVKISGVDVGGLDAGAARSRLAGIVAKTQQTPLVITAGPQRVTVVPRQLGMAVDVDGAVAQALAKTSQQDPVTRLFRTVTGADYAVNIDPSLLQAGLVFDRVRPLVDHPPQQPTVSVESSGKATVSSQSGVATDTSGLEHQIAHKLLSPGEEPTLSVPTIVVKPEQTLAGDELNRVVGRAHGLVDRPAQNARVNPSGDGLSVTNSSDGRVVNDQAFKDAIGQQIAVEGKDRPIPVPTQPVKPAVTRDQLAQQTPFYITINRSTYTLRLFKNLNLAHTYRIAVGQIGLQTPAGSYRIQNKAVNPTWYVPNDPWAGPQAGKQIPGNAPDNPIKARWMGIADGAGIHGTDDLASLGTAASHGCIRMTIPDVIDLFNQVPEQSPVFIS